MNSTISASCFPVSPASASVRTASASPAAGRSHTRRGNWLASRYAPWRSPRSRVSAKPKRAATGSLRRKRLGWRSPVGTRMSTVTVSAETSGSGGRAAAAASRAAAAAAWSSAARASSSCWRRARSSSARRAIAFSCSSLARSCACASSASIEGAMSTSRSVSMMETLGSGRREMTRSSWGVPSSMDFTTTMSPSDSVACVSSSNSSAVLMSPMSRWKAEKTGCSLAKVPGRRAR
mmetsp:Transcript_4607/g.13490  ORF Transcript_4607/g.13490 Transcript_4607/m.13490 type:complete len:235 (-) Transcript_4607:684-1388(-)